MTAANLCKGLSMRGHETIPPGTLAVLCAAQKLALQRRRITIRNLMQLTGITSPNGVLGHIRILRRSGLLRHEGPHQSGMAVACVFIPGERR